ncbi:DUF488 domain-containing protein [Kamptonema sp. UHCC 0994]|uniref:DUF488 domain-containing protein n=1 Tax=Kamptonema sp. UHCC 0994 TaxID=3031329 RepID=UPI0023B91E04|nr:DUF488 domain-containing protein [Kamptonema sp. UHCC 0994]MDF0552168.1 DUF488 domain-containing protein [Kamptonema sp. UHCC 0994]
MKTDSSVLSNNHYILTFGYGNRKNYEMFLCYLQKYDVKCVVDVRISPRAWTRRWYGEQIKELCFSNNIKYISTTSLGNISGKENWIPPNQEEADAALNKVAEIAQGGTILLLCAEMDHHRCHRVDVANELEKLVSLPVKHLD